MSYQTKIESWREKTNELKRQKAAAAAVAAAAKTALNAAMDELTAAETALAAAQHIAQGIQQQAHQRIAGLVSRCLEAIFDDPYAFTITFDRKRGRTEAALAFVRAGQALEPLGGAGGGPCEIAAFALRMACLMLAVPPRRRLLLIDEGFKFLSAEYRPRVRAMLELLSRELGVQIIQITHIPELQTGTVIEVTG